MDIPIEAETVAEALLPWLGRLLLQSSTLVKDITLLMSAYAPYRETFMELRDRVETTLITRLKRATNGSMMIEILND